MIDLDHFKQINDTLGHAAGAAVIVEMAPRLRPVVRAASAKTGRAVWVFVLIMIIADVTDEAAMAKWQSYRDGLDLDAVRWLMDQGAADTVNKDTNVRQLAAPEGAVNINMGTLVGSYESVARMLDEMAEVPGTGGVLLTFDEFEEGVEAFGTRIQPLMTCRQDRAA